MFHLVDKIPFSKELISSITVTLMTNTINIRTSLLSETSLEYKIRSQG